MPESWIHVAPAFSNGFKIAADLKHQAVIPNERSEPRDLR